MPRIPCGRVAGQAYHALNRGNGGAVLFHKDGDYAALLELLATARAKPPVKVFSFCLMPNHFHLVVQPATEVALSPFMQWWMTSHVRRYHRHYRSHGHVWQGRFKSFPIQQDDHLLTVLMIGMPTLLLFLSLNLGGHGSDARFGAVGIDGHGTEINRRIDDGPTSRHGGDSADFVLIASDDIHYRNIPSAVVELEYRSAGASSHCGFSFPVRDEFQFSFEYYVVAVKRAGIGQDVLNRHNLIGCQALEAGSE